MGDDDIHCFLAGDFERNYRVYLYRAYVEQWSWGSIESDGRVAERRRVQARIAVLRGQRRRSQICAEDGYHLAGRDGRLEASRAHERGDDRRRWRHD